MSRGPLAPGDRRGRAWPGPYDFTVGRLYRDLPLAKNIPIDLDLDIDGLEQDSSVDMADGDEAPPHESDILHPSLPDIPEETQRRDSSDSDYQHALEIEFDEQNTHRRKSSMVSAGPRPKIQQHKHTNCFIHSLLERENRDKIVPTADGIFEDRITDKGNDEREAHVRSRLLTKRQLSEMVLGVRELSKKMANVRVKMKVRTIFLLTKIHDENLITCTRELTEWLLSQERDHQYVVYVENILKTNKRFDAEGLIKKDPSYAGRLKYWTNELCSRYPHTFDFAITLGGDGTVLYASWLFQRVVPPVLSFALGSLGFLTKFDFNEYSETLTSALREGITVSLRLRFEVTIMRSQEVHKSGPRDLVEELVGEECGDDRTHQPDGTHEILNDVVVDRGPNPTMSSTELFGDDEHFTTVQADGICVATPTGSTAYNLAAGGSLCHPENPVILVTAICAHTLSFRPIILPDTIVLRIGVPYDARTSAWASFDGRERVELRPGDYVTVSASRYPFANVMPRGRRSQDWVSSIQRTLNWNSRQKQKSFKDWEMS